MKLKIIDIMRGVEMQVLVTNGCDERFILLCRELDEYLNYIVGGEKPRHQYMQHNTLEDIYDIVLIIEDGIVAGCGSFKKYNNESAEIKRVFVRDKYKGENMAVRL